MTVPRPYQVYAAELLEDEFEESVPPATSSPNSSWGMRFAEQTGMEPKYFDFGDDEEAGTDIFSLTKERSGPRRIEIT